MSITKYCLLLCGLLFTQQSNAQIFKVAVLQYGTVSWEMDVIKHHKLDKKYGFTLKLYPVASNNAVNIQFLSGNVDAIVGDWFWVSRQRDNGKMFKSYPYSLAAGELILGPESNIDNLEDLKNTKIGVAGSSVNKNWLIFRAYTKKRVGVDYNNNTTIKFAAPPILNQLLRRGEFTAVLNYWHYAAKLKTQGMKKLISVKDMLIELGVDSNLPVLVWIFRESVVQNQSPLIDKFLQASYDAKNILKNSISEWDRIQNITRINDEKELVNLREYYINSIPSEFTQKEITAAENLFSIISEYGGKDLVGNANSLNPETFYQRQPMSQ